MVITISGEYGCGSKESALLAAEALGYRVYDHEIVLETFKAGSLYMDETTLRYYDESEGRESYEDLEKSCNVRNGDPGVLQSLSLDVLPLDLRLDAAIHGALNRLAEGDNCILLGRCANYYLRDRDNVITMFFKDSDDRKTERIMKRFDCDAETARKFIRRTDKRRADCYTYFTGEKWADAKNYDVQVDCSIFGDEGSAELIRAMVAIRENKDNN